MEPFQEWLKKNLYRFDHPAVYLGTEPGTERRDWDKAPLKVCVCGASTYENLTGNLAVPMLVRMLLEAKPDWVVERAFFPCSRRDLEIFQKQDLPIFSLESKRRLSDFDVLAFSCSFQGLDLNVIKMLDLTKIPVKRDDRMAGTWPWIIRGGQNDANPAPFMDIYDLMYIGEAEVNFIKVLELIAIAQKKSVARKRTKQVLTKLDGILIPEYYQPTYDSAGYFDGWVRPAGAWEAPLPVKAARFYDMDAQYIYRHPIVNYLEEMGSGEILISRGCLANCAFCMEGNKEKPYRELSADNVVSAVKQSYRESGAQSVTLSAFCVSSYRQKKTVIKRLLEEVTDDVGLTSQRVDESASDLDFMKWTAAAGNRSVSFGVEGASERLRKLVNKHASKRDILKAVDNAIQAGYNKIKLFMISNLPTENDTDREELVELARMVKAVRDRHPQKKVQIRFNWTDLTITPYTPFQWLKPTMGGRHLRPFLKQIQSYGLRVGFGSGKGHELDTLLQLMHIGDGRLTDMLINIVKKHSIVYFRQVSRNTLDLVDQELAEKGLSRDTWWRPKSYPSALPWDIIDYGVKKKVLWKILADGFKGVETTKCNEKCYGCGACTKDYHIKDLGSEPADISPPNIVKRTAVNQHIVVRLRIKGHHRFVSASARKQLVRRMFYMHDIPIMKDIEVASDTVRANDWVMGTDYAAVRVWKRLTATDQANLWYEICEKNDSKTRVFDVAEIKVRDTGAAKILSGRLLCWSTILVDHPIKYTRERMEYFLAGHNTIMRVRVEGYTGSETKELAGKEMVKGAWIASDKRGFWLNLLHRGSISIYDFYAHILKIRSWREVAGLKAIRVNFFMEQEQLGAEECQACGRDVFYTPYGEGVCLKCAREGELSEKI